MSGAAGREPAEDPERTIARLEAELRATAELFDFVAHELMTPVTSLDAFAFILARDTPVGESAAAPRCLDGIARNARRLVALVEEMLEIGRLRAGRIHVQRVPFDLRAIADAEAVARACPPEGPRLEIDRGPEPLPVSGDRARLAQALAEMARDCAARAAAAGGGSPVTLRFLRRASRGRVEARDRAPALPEGRVEKALRGQRRTADAAPGGTLGGLGLALGGEVIARCGGEFGGASGPEGNLLWFELPLEE